MFLLKFNSFDFDQQMPLIAESVSNHHYGRRVEIKESIATGYFKVLKFPNGIKAVITNYVMNQDFLGERHNVEADYYLLHLNIVKTGPEFRVRINGQELTYDDQVFTPVFLTDSKEPYALKGSAGTCFCQLKIAIPKNGSALGAADSFSPELLTEYFDNKEGRLEFDFMDNTYRNLMDKVMNTQDNVYYLAVTQSIISVIIERFFSRMKTKLEKGSKGLGQMDQVA